MKRGVSGNLVVGHPCMYRKYTKPAIGVVRDKISKPSTLLLFRQSMTVTCKNYWPLNTRNAIISLRDYRY